MRKFSLLTTGLLASLLAVGTTFAQDHLDGIGDSLFLFNAGSTGGAGVWSMNQWNPNGSNVPPPSFFGSSVVSGGFVFHGDGTVVGGIAANTPLVGDLNGDGIADIAASGTNGGGTGVFIGRNTGVDGGGVGNLSQPAVGNVGFPDNFTFLSGSQDYFLGDVNGDGRADAIAAHDDGIGNTVWEAKTSDANGIDDGTGSGGVLSFSGFGQTGNEALVGDFNGDGLTDVGQVIIGGGSNGFAQFILSKDNLNATGVGLNSTATAGNVDIVQGPSEINTNHIKTLVGDLNGDGLDDLVSVDDRFGTGALLWVAKLTGASADPSGLGIAAGGGSFTNGIFAPNANDTSAIPLLADINGDGRDDLVLYHEFTDPGDASAGTDVLGQFLVAYTDAAGDLGASVFSDQVFYNLTAAGGTAGNIPLAGQVHLTSTANADFDSDSDIDGSDFLTWQRNHLSGTTLAQGDANGDGAVDAIDLGIWNNQYGTVPPLSAISAVSAVPEPASILLLGLAGLVLLSSRGRTKG